MRDPRLSFVLFWALLPVSALPCPKSEPELIRPDYGVYPSSITFVPACSDKADVPNCSKDAPYLIVKGIFLKDGTINDKADLDALLGNKSSKEPPLLISVRVEGSSTPGRFKVKEGDTEAFGRGFSMVRGTVTIKEQEGFAFSSGGELTRALTIQVLDADGKAVDKARSIQPGSGKFPPFSPRYATRPCNKYKNQLPKKIEELQPYGLPYTLPASQPTREKEIAPPVGLPALVPVPFSLERWLSFHKGQVLACQVTLFLLLGLFGVVRRGSSLSVVFWGASLGGASLGAVSFLSIYALLPVYAGDLSVMRWGVLLFFGASFGLLGGALVGLFSGARLLVRFTPSLDLPERVLFQSALWLFWGALWGIFWGDLFLKISLGFMGLSLLLFVACLVVGWRRFLWLERIKRGAAQGLYTAPYQESFSKEPLVPVFYHPRYNSLCDVVILKEAASPQEPYRQKENPIWLFSSHLQGQNYATYRMLSALMLGGLLLMLILWAASL